MKAEILQIGLLIDPRNVCAWQYAICQSLLEAECVNVRLLILPDKTDDLSPSVALGKPMLYRAFKRFDRKLRPGLQDACSIKSAEQLFPNITHITASDLLAASTENNDAPGSLAKSVGKVDFIFSMFEPGEFRRVANACRFGMLYFRHGALKESGNGSIVGFWEVIRRFPYVRSELFLLESGTGREFPIYDTTSSTFYVSHARTRNEHLWKCADIALRVLNAAAPDRDGNSVTFRLSTPASHRGEKPADAPAICNRTLLIPFLQFLIWRLKKNLAQKACMERWILMYGKHSLPGEISDFEKIQPPVGRFWADPFGIRRNGRNFVFFEDASVRTGLGRIAVLGIDNEIEIQKPRTILEKPYHLSYPFLFEWQEKLYMIPESAAHRTIDVFECVDFPYAWEQRLTLMSGIRAYDATLFPYSDLWWMFVNMKSRRETSAWDELHLFYANTPLDTEWHPHALNPIVSDVRYARPAGNLFIENGRIFRPSQDSSHRYGFRLNCMEVTEMSKTTYRERVAWSVGPTKRSAIRAIHTYNRFEDLVFIDAIHRERRNTYMKRTQD